MDRKTSLVAVVVSAACFSTLGILTELAYRQGAQPLPLLAWRFALVALLMGGYQLLRDPGVLVAGLQDIWRYVALALAGYGASSICFFFALKQASPAIVAVLLYTYPAMVSVLSAVFFKERFTSQRIVALLLSFVGCALVLGVLTTSAAASPLGILLGLGAALGYSLFNLLSYRWLPGRSRLVLQTYTFGLSAIVIGLLTLVTGGSLSVSAWTPTLWGYVALIVVVPTLLAVTLYLNGIRHLGPAQAAIVSTAEPLFTIVFAWMVLGDRLTPIQLAGALLVVGGVVAAEWGPPRPSVHPDELAAI